MRLWIKIPEGRKNRSFRFILLFILMAGLVISVKSCESINYAKKKKQSAEQKEVVIKKQVIDFEEKINEKYTVIDTLAFNGNKSCIITPEREYGPEHRIEINDIDVDKLKEIRVLCAIFNSHPELNNVHAIMELRKSSNNSRLGWKNKSFPITDRNNKWINNSFLFNIDRSNVRPDSYIKFYIWNNSDHNVIIDDFIVEFIYLE